MMHRVHSTTLGMTLTLAVIAAACGSGPDDEQVTIKVQSKLNGAPQTSMVEAQSKHDVVTLMGTVESDEAKATADRLARTVKGVKEVQNRIAVRPHAPTTTSVTIPKLQTDQK
jgi:hyperosmotically inducible protein